MADFVAGSPGEAVAPPLEAAAPPLEAAADVDGASSNCAVEPLDVEPPAWPWPRAPTASAWTLGVGGVKGIATGSAAELLYFPAGQARIAGPFEATAFVSLGSSGRESGGGWFVIEPGLVGDNTLRFVFCGVFGAVAGAAAVEAVSGACDPAGSRCPALRALQSAPAAVAHRVTLRFDGSELSCEVDGASRTKVTPPSWWPSRQGLALFVESTSASFQRLRVCGI